MFCNFYRKNKCLMEKLDIYCKLNGFSLMSKLTVFLRQFSKFFYSVFLVLSVFQIKFYQRTLKTGIVLFLFRKCSPSPLFLKSRLLQVIFKLKTDDKINYHSEMRAWITKSKLFGKLWRIKIKYLFSSNRWK